MTNLSLQSKTNFLAALPVIFMVLANLYFGLFKTWQPPLLILLVLSIIIAGIVYQQMQSLLDMIEKISCLSKEITQGRLEVRITGIEANNPVQDTAWNINAMLDQVECCMRESTTVFQHLIEGKYYRASFPDGLHGDFGQLLGKINVAMQQQKTPISEIQRIVHILPCQFIITIFFYFLYLISVLLSLIFLSFFLDYIEFPLLLSLTTLISHQLMLSFRIQKTQLNQYTLLN